MPCCLPPENDIPIGRYGTSNVGRAKTVYRVGLSHRYGKRMQMISGLHYNFSLPEDAWPLPDSAIRTTRYFALIRNFRRHAWLLLYLFGASPAVCATFVEGRAAPAADLRAGTRCTCRTRRRCAWGGSATSPTRRTRSPSSYNSLDTLHGVALRRADAAVSAVRDDRDPRAATSIGSSATTLLQIENEFYSTIRPKRVIRPGERPLHALRERGVEYIEVRAMDLDPFEPIGIRVRRSASSTSSCCTACSRQPARHGEIEAIGRNKQRVAARGREPGLMLERNGVQGRRCASGLGHRCGSASRSPRRSTSARRQRLSRRPAAAKSLEENPELLPSARVLAEMRDRYENSYGRFG